MITNKLTSAYFTLVILLTIYSCAIFLYTVYVGRVDEYEIDFVAVDTLQNLTYYQVALETLNEETLSRELRPLQKISDSYPKYLLTLDTIGTEANYNGIVKMSALDWLLSENK